MSSTEDKDDDMSEDNVQFTDTLTGDDAPHNLQAGLTKNLKRNQNLERVYFSSCIQIIFRNLEEKTEKTLIIVKSNFKDLLKGLGQVSPYWAQVSLRHPKVGSHVDEYQHDVDAKSTRLTQDFVCTWSRLGPGNLTDSRI